ncbi:hypothetical protein FB451DRAFT_1216032, partial [Mycena latifolia]
MSLPTFTFSTTANEVAYAFAEQIRGKNVLITGTLRLSEEAIKKEVPEANVRPLVLDLSSLAAVRKAAAAVNAYPEPLHVLIHNAAAMAPQQLKLTEDATAHIGPFLLTKLLTPKLLAPGSESYTPRVVMVLSIARAKGSGVNLNTLAHPDPEKCMPNDGYAQAKSANILFAIELSKCAQGKINAYSLHPGVVFTNPFQNEGIKAEMIAVGILTPDGLPNKEKLTSKTLPQGAATTVAAAFDTRLDAKSGAYLVDCVAANDQIATHSSDSETAGQVWTISEEIVGETFTF